MSKVIRSAAAAVVGIQDGATLMIGGFGAGTPENLILALHKQGSQNLTVICNATGSGGQERVISISGLIKSRQVRKVIVSFTIPSWRSFPELEEQYAAGEIEIELVPQGTLAERIRAGGAGIGGFYTQTGVGTSSAQGKEVKILNGKEYVLEMPLRADFALIKAFKADTLGNLVYRRTSRNYNPIMATAARTTIAEVDQIVQPEDLDPEQIGTPGIYVDRIIAVHSQGRANNVPGKAPTR